MGGSVAKMVSSPLSDAAGGLAEDPPCLFILSAETIYDLGIRDCSSVRKSPEGIEQFETDSWNNEQVHGGNVRRVVTQEGSPSVAGRPPSFDHVLGDARLRGLKPELEQFAVDAWRAPKRIFDAHPPDQCAQLRVDLRSPSLWARLPTPVAAKAGPVPTHERLGPDDCENLQD